MEIKNKKKRKRELLEHDRQWTDKKIAILNGSSPGEIPDFLEIFLLENDIRPTFYVGDYNRYYEEALFSSELVEFKPDIVYIHTTNYNIEAFADMNDSKEIAQEKLDAEFDRWIQIWKSCQSRLSCVVIQNNFDLPHTRPIGNLDGVDFRGRVWFIRELNKKMVKYAEENSGFYIQDIEYLSACEGLSVWHNPTYMHLYKYAVSLESMPVLAKNLAAMIISLLGKRKKCLVLDLDNTLWGGVVGDIGAENIKIGAETAEGEAFSDFQKYVKQLSKTGVLLCVASKNEEEAAKSGFNADGMVLSLDDFICFYANWEPKSESLKKMAEEMNLGLDSFVFVDDNPAERELVKQYLPMVSVIDADKPEDFITALDKSGYFEPVALSDEDLKRTGLYAENKMRSKGVSEFSDYKDYLSSLEMSAEIGSVSDKNKERVTQLIGKTNQFNLTAWRLTEEDVTAVSNDNSWVTMCGRLSDKFGDNGLVTVILGKQANDTLFIKLWIMSCRVFSRHLEYAMFDRLIEICKQKGVKIIRGEYILTTKNKPVENLYKELGFDLVSSEEKTGTVWEYCVNDGYTCKNTVISVSLKD